MDFQTFAEHFEKTARTIDADYAALTNEQRKRKPRHSSPRIDEIIRSYNSLHHPTGRQITLVRLGIDPETCLGYGDDKFLANFARKGLIRIYPDRQRRPSVIKILP